MNQDINHPLFQALVDQSSETEDDDNENDANKLEHGGNPECDGGLPTLILPHNIQKPISTPRGTCNKLIEEVNDK